MNVSRESIFVSAVRSFCSSLSAIIGILIGLFIVGFLFLMTTKPDQISDKTTLMIAADANGNRKMLSTSTPAILRINVHGVIGLKDFNAKTVASQLLDSQEGMLKGNRVKGILLHINTPGGAADDSYEIYSMLKEYKEKYKVPIYAYVNGLCASGGMMIACAADKVLSSPIGIIGSVGVIMGPNFNISGLMERYGVSQTTLTRGKDKDMLSPYRPWKPGEDDSLQELITYDYNTFVNIVTSARPRIEKNALINTYGAQVFAPPKAEELGYIDSSNSSYNLALSNLVNQAGIKKDEPYQVVELRVVLPMLSSLIEGKSPIFSGKVKHELHLLPEFTEELTNRPLYLYSPTLQRMNSE